MSLARSGWQHRMRCEPWRRKGRAALKTSGEETGSNAITSTRKQPYAADPRVRFQTAPRVAGLVSDPRQPELPRPKATRTSVLKSRGLGGHSGGWAHFNVQKHYLSGDIDGFRLNKMRPSKVLSS